MSTSPDPVALTRRIEALLAKADSSEFPREAEAFIAKAQELMSRHAIDDARLRRSGARPMDGVVHRVVDVDAPYAAARTSVLGAVARHNHCRVVLDGRSAAPQRCHLLGYPTDVDLVRSLFASLSNQALQAIPATPPGQGPRRFRHAFLLAYAARIGERLEAAAAVSRADVERTTGRSVQLALRDRRDAVDQATRDRFPLTAPIRRSSSSRAGNTSGRAAADRAALGHRAISGLGQLPRRSA